MKVSRYRRRHPLRPPKRTAREQKRVVERGLDILERLGYDQHFDDICEIRVSDDDSQVMPAAAGFRRGHCTVVNMQRSDVADEVESATTIFHENLHAHDIAQDGEDGVSKEREIDAHWRTIEFLKDWLKREKSKRNRRRIEEELEEEKESIEYLEAH